MYSVTLLQRATAAFRRPVAAIDLERRMRGCINRWLSVPLGCLGIRLDPDERLHPELLHCVHV
jgi:hypothetical protein